MCKDSNYDKNIYICAIYINGGQNMLKKHIHILSLILVTLAACTPDWKDEVIPDPSVTDQQTGSIGDRDINTDTRKVMLLYSAGFNSLSSYLKDDIEDLCNGWTPSKRRADDVILVYSHLPSSPNKYYEESHPVLFRLYSGPDGNPVRDTLLVYGPETISASAEQFNGVLTYVKDNFPAKHYGLIFSSHATGYLPSGFYSDPAAYTFQEGKMFSQGKRARWSAVPVPYKEPEQIPGLPAVKSVGQDVATGRVAYEMDIKDFAEAIPMKLDYILFDACLMGGIEVAYELAGKCDRIGFSQAEVLAEGFNYTTLASHLLGNKTESDPASVCKDYFAQYDIQPGVYRSATISMVDCNNLEPLAELCNTLFSKYFKQIQTLNPTNIQRFYRSSKHWFYDLQSILENVGITEEEKADLKDTFDKCVIYKGATPSFMEEFPIKTFCGFSMYLPSHGHLELDKYYKTLKWNKATGLVK